MVVHIENIANKFLSSTFSSSTMSKLQTSALPTVFPSNNTGMNNSTRQEPANNSEVRERIPTTAFNLSRESSIASSEQATPYCDRMHDRMDCDFISRDMAPELSYKTEQEKALWTSKAADLQNSMRIMNGNNEAPLPHAHHKDSIINI